MDNSSEDKPWTPPSFKQNFAAKFANAATDDEKQALLKRVASINKSVVGLDSVSFLEKWEKALGDEKFTDKKAKLEALLKKAGVDSITKLDSGGLKISFGAPTDSFVYMKLLVETLGQEGDNLSYISAGLKQQLEMLFSSDEQEKQDARQKLKNEVRFNYVRGMDDRMWAKG